MLVILAAGVVPAAPLGGVITITTNNAVAIVSEPDFWIRSLIASELSGGCMFCTNGTVTHFKQKLVSFYGNSGVVAGQSYRWLYINGQGSDEASWLDIETDEVVFTGAPSYRVPFRLSGGYTVYAENYSGAPCLVCRAGIQAAGIATLVMARGRFDDEQQALSLTLRWGAFEVPEPATFPVGIVAGLLLYGKRIYDQTHRHRNC